MKKYIMGNWKMHGLTEDLVELREIDNFSKENANVDVAIAPPFTLINAAAQHCETIAIGAQDCHISESGAHTGCISAAMIRKSGGSFAIVGHSERRKDQFEKNLEISSKAAALHKQGMHAIICVGETLAERDSGCAEEIVTGMLAASLPRKASSDWVTVAYEPVWAIGTGRIPQMEEIARMHNQLRALLVKKIGDDGHNIRILYGGSVKGENALDILSQDNVGGALVGGASLTAQKFIPIIKAAAELNP